MLFLTRPKFLQQENVEQVELRGECTGAHAACLLGNERQLEIDVRATDSLWPGPEWASESEVASQASRHRRPLFLR